MIDIPTLRKLLEGERDWRVDFRHVYGNGTKYSFGEFETDGQAALAVAAVNALPALLAIAEAAEKWRDCDESPGPRCNCLHALADAVDAARRETP